MTTTSPIGGDNGASAGGIADAGIYAFSPLPPAAAAAAPRARRRWPWVLLVCLLALGLLALLAAMGLAELLGRWPDGMNVMIDGHRWDPLWSGPEHATIALLATAAGLLVLLLVVPLVVLLVLVAVTLAIALAVGSSLLVVLVVAAVVLSPLWLLALVVWLLVRRRAPAPASMPA